MFLQKWTFGVKLVLKVKVWIFQLILLIRTEFYIILHILVLMWKYSQKTFSRKQIMKTISHSEKSKDQSDKIHCLISCRFSNPSLGQEGSLSFPDFLQNHNRANNKDFLGNFLPTLATRMWFIPPHPTLHHPTLPYHPLILKTPPDLV